MKALSKTEHLEKATHNERFFEAVFGEQLGNNTAYIDWATTIVFYSALHYIDALLDHIGKTVDNHDQRRKFVTIEPRLRTVADSYKWLYDRSRDARYCNLSANTTPATVQSWKSRYFEQIKHHVDEELKRP